MSSKKLLIVVMAMSINGYVHAQEYRGRVQGTVSDTSQAVMVGAKVILHNVDTGLQESRVTGATGRYLFDMVQPGSYTVTAESRGFSTTVQESVLVQTRADVTVDLVMKVGALSDVVTVTASPVSVPMNTSRLEVVVDNAMVKSIPTFTRNVYLMAQLEASVEKPRGYTETKPFETYAAGGSTVAGAAPYTTQIQIDGADAITGQKVGYAPPQDAVQEVTLQQNAVDAENGYGAGSSLTIALKSGTNQFHGTAYYMGQYPWLDAIENRYSRSINQGRNQIGSGSLGHPILKNKLFNFVSYEQWNQITPQETTFTMPTDLERSGDFSQSLNPKGGQRLIYDPWTTTVSGNTSTRAPFPGNKIPAPRISKVAQTWASQLWSPNRQGTGPDRVSNFIAPVPLQYKYKNILDRADWYVTDKLRVFARYSRLNAPGTDGNPTSSPLWVDADGSLNYGMGVSANGVYTVSARTVVNVTWERHAMNDDAQYLGTTGPAAWQSLWPNSSWYQPLFSQSGQTVYQPRIELTGSGSNFIAGTNNYIWQKDATASSLGVKVAHDRGRHYLKMGGDTRVINGLGTSGGMPGFSFRSLPTVADFVNPNSLSGDSTATMLLGVVEPGGGSQSSFPMNALQRPSSRSYSAYIQDDFKVSRRVTLNLGLRYEYEQPFVEANNRFSIGPDLTKPIPALLAAMPAIPAAVSQYYTGTWSPNGPWRFTDSSHRGEWQGGWGNLQPRFGVVVKLDDKTSLRAAWARFAIPWQYTKDYYRGETDFWGSDTPGFSATTTAPGLLGGMPGMALDSPFPSSNPLIAPIGKSQGIYTMLGSGSAYFYTQDRVKPYSDRLNVSFARQLPKGMVFEATFFYNRSHNTDSLGSTYRDLNAVDPRLGYQYKQALSATVSNPFYNFLTADQFPGSLRYQKQITIQSLMKPYPQYGSLLQGQTPGSGDSYKSAQLRVQKSFSDGVSLLAGYNYHYIQQTGFFDDVATYLHQFSWQDYDGPRHRLDITGVWEVPVGDGRRFLNAAPRGLDLIVGGWSLSEVMTWRSGFFLRFGPMIANGNPVIDNPTVSRWFNTSVFSHMPSFTPRTNPLQYPGLTGPGQRDFDARVSKSIRINERIHAELILDALNVLNSFTPASPNTNVDSSQFGQCIGQQRYTFGRRVQPSLRITF